MQGDYVTFPHHNDESHLDRGVADDTILKRFWRRLAAQSARWYATPSGAVGRRFTAILASEWQGVLSRSWNSEIPFVFVHFVLKKMLGVHRAKEIWARITRRMNLWERGLHADLVGDSEAEGADREGRAASGKEEEEETVAEATTTLFCQVRRGEGVSSGITNTQKLGDRLHRFSGRSTQTHECPPLKIPRVQP